MVDRQYNQLRSILSQFGIQLDFSECGSELDEFGCPKATEAQRLAAWEVEKLSTVSKRKAEAHGVPQGTSYAELGMEHPLVAPALAATARAVAIAESGLIKGRVGSHLTEVRSTRASKVLSEPAKRRSMVHYCRAVGIPIKSEPTQAWLQAQAAAEARAFRDTLAAEEEAPAFGFGSRPEPEPVVQPAVEVPAPAAPAAPAASSLELLLKARAKGIVDADTVLSLLALEAGIEEGGEE